MSALLSESTALLDQLEAQAERHETAFASGRVVWRRWGQGEPVVLLHGGGGSWSHWARNIAPLAAHRTVWAPDLPGLGDSDAPASFSVETVAAPLAEGLRELLPGQAFDLVTFSFGGPVGAYVATRPGMRIRHLVMTAARFVLEEGHTFPTLARWKGIEDEAGRMAAHRRNLELMMIADPANIDALALRIQATNTPKARFSGPPLKPGEKLHRYLPQVKAEGSITAISGTRDQVAHKIMSQQQAALSAIHAGARFHPIEGAGHWVQYEAADAYNPLLLDALHIGRDQG